jgi:hypothetical protein
MYTISWRWRWILCFRRQITHLIEDDYVHRARMCARTRWRSRIAMYIQEVTRDGKTHVSTSHFVASQQRAPSAVYRSMTNRGPSGCQAHIDRCILLACTIGGGIFSLSLSLFLSLLFYILFPVHTGNVFRDIFTRLLIRSFLPFVHLFPPHATVCLSSGIRNNLFKKNKQKRITASISFTCAFIYTFDLVDNDDGGEDASVVTGSVGVSPLLSLLADDSSVNSCSSERARLRMMIQP